MSKIKLAIVFCVIAVLLALLGDCRMSCTVGNKDSGDSVSVPENQEEISETDSSRP